MPDGRSLYRRRGSRKHCDRIEAVRFNGFDRLFTGHHDHWVFPDWLPPITQEVIDQQGTYDMDMDDTPQGEAWKLGPYLDGSYRLRIPTASGHRTAARGDYLVRYPTGEIDVMEAAELHEFYVRMS